MPKDLWEGQPLGRAMMGYATLMARGAEAGAEMGEPSQLAAVCFYMGYQGGVGFALRYSELASQMWNRLMVECPDDLMDEDVFLEMRQLFETALKEIGGRDAPASA